MQDNVTKPRFPDVQVELTGAYGNVISLTTMVGRALRRAGHREAADDLYEQVRQCASYDEVRQLLSATVEVI